MRIDFAQLEALHARARRERAQAVYRLLIAPLVGFFTSKPASKHAPLRSRLA